MKKTIEPKYVSFPIAKLLKEKHGFHNEVRALYIEEELHKPKHMLGDFNNLKWVRSWRTSPNDDTISAPEQWMVVEWLKENHGIWVSVQPDCYGERWFVRLDTCSKTTWENLELRNKITSSCSFIPEEAKTPEEAYSEAFNYIFNNII